MLKQIRPSESKSTHTMAETTRDVICLVVIMMVKIIGPNFLIV